jgi:response regulator RpfG family c-di-GMP phosphodiesterase
MGSERIVRAHMTGTPPEADAPSLDVRQTSSAAAQIELKRVVPSQNAGTREKTTIEGLYSRVHSARGLDGNIDDLVEHVRRTCALTEELSGRLKLTADERAITSQSAAMHDIGKLADQEIWGLVSAPVVYPNSSDSPERRLIDEHSDRSLMILREAGVILPKGVTELIRHHHHPERIPGERLRLMGEIVYWADHTDALMGRPYNTPPASLADLERDLDTEAKRAFGEGVCARKDVYSQLREVVESPAFRNLYPSLRSA